jgi:hypothetical protein
VSSALVFGVSAKTYAAHKMRDVSRSQNAGQKECGLHVESFAIEIAAGCAKYTLHK